MPFQDKSVNLTKPVLLSVRMSRFDATVVFKSFHCNFRKEFDSFATGWKEL